MPIGRATQRRAQIFNSVNDLILRRASEARQSDFLRSNRNAQTRLQTDPLVQDIHLTRRIKTLTANARCRLAEGKYPCIRRHL